MFGLNQLSKLADASKLANVFGEISSKIEADFDAGVTDSPLPSPAPAPPAATSLPSDAAQPPRFQYRLGNGLHVAKVSEWVIRGRS